MHDDLLSAIRMFRIESAVALLSKDVCTPYASRSSYQKADVFPLLKNSAVSLVLAIRPCPFGLENYESRLQPFHTQETDVEGSYSGSWHGNML